MRMGVAAHIAATIDNLGTGRRWARGRTMLGWPAVAVHIVCAIRAKRGRQRRFIQVRLVASICQQFETGIGYHAGRRAVAVVEADKTVAAHVAPAIG
jgi:hypothetical protein